MDSIKDDLKFKKSRLNDNSPLYFRDRAIQEVYDLAITISRSGASQSRKLQKLVFGIYRIEMTAKARIRFSEIYTSWPYCSPKMIEKVRDKYELKSDNFISLFMIADMLSRVNSSFPSYHPSNYSIIFRVLTDINNILRQIALSSDGNDGEVLSISTLVNKIGEKAWTQEVIATRIERISKAADLLYVNNLRKERFDAQMEKWDEDEYYGYGHGGVW